MEALCVYVSIYTDMYTFIVCIYEYKYIPGVKTLPFFLYFALRLRLGRRRKRIYPGCLEPKRKERWRGIPPSKPSLTGSFPALRADNWHPTCQRGTVTATLLTDSPIIIVAIANDRLHGEACLFGSSFLAQVIHLVHSTLFQTWIFFIFKAVSSLLL